MVDEGLDTYFCSGSVGAIEAAMGTLIEAISDVINGRVANAFCAIRPPGEYNCKPARQAIQGT